MLIDSILVITAKLENFRLLLTIITVITTPNLADVLFSPPFVY